MDPQTPTEQNHIDHLLNNECFEPHFLYNTPSHLGKELSEPAPHNKRKGRPKGLKSTIRNQL
jgi:hypothetical protein